MANESPSIVFVIKNPSKGDDSFRLTVSLESTLADVQRMIHESYDGKPAPSTQTLIYAGKVLKDVNAKVKDILKEPIDPNTPQSLHLVVRTRSMTTGLRSVRPPAAPQTPPPGSSSSTAYSTGEPSNRAGPSTAPLPPQPQPYAGQPFQFGSMAASPFGTPGAQVQGAATDAAVAGEASTSAANGAGPAFASAATAGAAAASAPFAAGVQMGGMGMSSPFLTMPLLQQQQQQPVLLVNPMVAAAYQAAYTAALAAAQNVQQQMQSNGDGASTSSNTTNAQQPPLVPFVPPFAPAFALCYSAPYNQAAQNPQGMAGGVAGPFGAFGAMPQPPYGVPGAYPWNPYAAGMNGNAGAPTSAGQLPQGARRRFVFANRQAAADADGQHAPHAAQPQQHPHAQHMPQQPQQQPNGPVAVQRRGNMRTITFRISARTLLQALVFAIVLWQHATWQRLALLLVGALVLYVTSSWAPFRQFITSLAVPPPPRGAAGAGQAGAAANGNVAGAAGVNRPAMAAAQQQQAGVGVPPAQHMAAGGAGAAGAAAAAAAMGQGAGAVAPGGGNVAGAAAAGLPGQRTGVLWEIMTLVVGFVTSLLPAWNFNQDDAAVLAAAQELLVREERQERQRQQGQAAQVVGDEPRVG